MSKSVADVMQLVKDEDVKFVDFRFTDTRGKEQHVSVPVSAFDEDKFESGHAFDGSSIAGWKGIEASDMLLVPDADTAFIDPFYEESTLHNVAHTYGKTATFMPKPIVGDNGSGMHVHQSIWKDGQNLFAGNGYAGLSEFALFYIGGIIKHARALNAITNPGTNSYKRLVPHFEAPVKLAYSARNRSASIRIPHVSNPKGRRIETRFPDPLANPYLCFSALMMAGLDGVQNKIHPGEAADKNLYDLPPEEDKKIPTVCAGLDQALDALDADREFLTRGGVFTDSMLDAYIELKTNELQRYRQAVHPIEFEMYYSL
jgi:glutamine synthetase type I